MPGMPDPRFARTVIFMCAHSASGAMGLVVNKVLDQVRFADLLKQLNIEGGEAMPTSSARLTAPVHFGGPVETGRGFVLHSDDYVREATLQVGHGFALTATIEVLRSIALGEGPKHSLLALGYAGWAPGQLDAEIQANGWLHAPADTQLVFGAGLDDKWIKAVAKLGVDVALLSGEAGHA